LLGKKGYVVVVVVVVVVFQLLKHVEAKIISMHDQMCLTCEQASAEADAFFCFVELLSGFRDNFCKQLDNSVVGIRSTITRLSQLLKRHDEELWRHLEVVTKVFTRIQKNPFLVIEHMEYMYTYSHFQANTRCVPG